MEEYWIVPKRVMDQKLTQMQINKEPPEAAEIVNIDALTKKILNRKDISEWQKADMLASSLERFLALRPRAIGDSQVPAMHRPNPTVVIKNEPGEHEDSSQRGRKRKADSPSGPRKLKPVALPDNVLTDDEDEQPVAPAEAPNINPEPVLLDLDAQLQRGCKRKARCNGGPKKMKRVDLNEDLLTEDEDDEPAPRGEKRKAKSDRTAKRMRAEQEDDLEDPPQRGLKRKAQTNRKAKRTKPTSPADDEVEPRGIKRKATTKIPAKRTKMLKSLKRKFEEIAEPDNMLRKRSQIGSGAFKWIHVY